MPVCEGVVELHGQVSRESCRAAVRHVVASPSDYVVLAGGIGVVGVVCRLEILVLVSLSVYPETADNLDSVRKLVLRVEIVGEVEVA